MEKIFIDPNNIDYSLIKKTADFLRQGKLAAFPTETVYGIGCRADKRDAVSRLYAVKKRPQDKPFAIALSQAQNSIDNYFLTLTPFGHRLIEKFWPGPLTIIYYTPKNQKIGIRVPSHIVANEILKELNLAVYLPSANISGEKEAVSALEVEKVFDGKVDLLVDSGVNAHSQPSTIVDLTYNPFKIVREGVISEKEVVSSFVRKRILFICDNGSFCSPIARFLLEKYLSMERVHFDIRYEIISRGISVSERTGTDERMVSILKEKEDLDLSGSLAKALSKLDVLSSDLIFTMNDSQSERILKLEQTAEGRVFTLKKFLFSDSEQDIESMSEDLTSHETAYTLIRKAVLELKDWI
ncbi:MAG: L-threonylcarbamoyladenylate synthase [Candidatus Omnitrophota bacterium]